MLQQKSNYITNSASHLNTVKSHVKALGVYEFIRGFRCAYKPGGLYLGEGGGRRKKAFRNNKINHVWKMN